MGDLILLSNLSRPLRLIELSNATQMASRTLAENTRRKCVSRELRDLIFRMVTENSTWGAPRIHGELKMLGFDISERTVLRWMRKAPRDPKPAERWMTF